MERIIFHTKHSNHLHLLLTQFTPIAFTTTQPHKTHAINFQFEFTKLSSRHNFSICIYSNCICYYSTTPKAQIKSSIWNYYLTFMQNFSIFNMHLLLLNHTKHSINLQNSNLRRFTNSTVFELKILKYLNII